MQVSIAGEGGELVESHETQQGEAVVYIGPEVVEAMAKIVQSNDGFHMTRRGVADLSDGVSTGASRPC
jgi:hypothetical protein